MTKSLTEQWREGTLEQKYYYVKYFGNGQKPFVEIELKNFLLDLVNVKDRDKIEVLASVPTYAEFMDLMSSLEYIDKYRELVSKTEQLEKKLTIATKALKEYSDREKWEYCSPDWRDAEKALKEMEGVK